MLFYEELTPDQIDMLRHAFFDEVAGLDEFPDLESVTDEALENHYWYMTFEPDDFEPGGTYYCELG